MEKKDIIYSLISMGISIILSILISKIFYRKMMQKNEEYNIIYLNKTRSLNASMNIRNKAYIFGTIKMFSIFFLAGLINTLMGMIFIPIVLREIQIDYRLSAIQIVISSIMTFLLIRLYFFVLRKVAQK